MRRTLTATMILSLAAGALGYAVYAGAGPAQPSHATEPTMQDNEQAKKTWQVYEIENLIKKRAESTRTYLPFLNEPTMSMGVYFLPKDGVDRQSPHDLDEVYYVLSGKGMLQVDGDLVPCKPGSVLFVKARAEHRFHAIEEDLTLLVFFSAAPVSREE